MTRMLRNPLDGKEYPEAPEDEVWLRGAALIDGAYAATHAMYLERLANEAVAPPVGAVPPTLAGRAGGEKGAAA